MTSWTGSGLGWVVLHCYSPWVLEPRALQVCPSVLVRKGVNACFARGVGNWDLIKRTPPFALMGVTDAPKGAPFQTNKQTNKCDYSGTFIVHGLVQVSNGNNRKPYGTSRDCDKKRKQNFFS